LTKCAIGSVAEAQSYDDTDSGGVQEEVAALGIPVLVTRKTSELLTDPALYAERAVPTDAFGDGRAGERIAELLAG
jgi:UDP-N-acetylglucosamine 2-epimerase